MFEKRALRDPRERRILQLSKFYPPHRGGVEQVAFDITRALASKRHLVVAFTDQRTPSCERYGGSTVRRLPVRWVVASQPLSLRYIVAGIRALRSAHTVIVHVPNYLALVVSLFARGNTPSVIYWHSDVLHSGILPRLLRPLERLSLARAAKIVVTSPQYRSFSPSLTGFREKCVVIPNCVDPAAFAQFDPDRTPEKESQTALFIGRHVEYKGLWRLIEIARQSPTVNYIIAGEGPLTPQLKKKVAALGLDNIVFAGMVDAREKERLLSSASVFVFPSISRAEAFGVALLEAQLFSCPCVTFDVAGSGMSYVNLDGETGYVVSSTSHFAAKVISLASDPALRRTLGENARRRVLRLFTLEKTSELLKRLVEEVTI